MTRLTIKTSPARSFICAFGVAIILAMAPTVNAQTFVVDPVEYPGALRNPLKGFRPLTKDALAEEKRFATITHSYFKWNELENDKSDTVERIRDLCDVRWDGVEEKGIKVIPSIYFFFRLFFVLVSLASLSNMGFCCVGITAPVEDCHALSSLNSFAATSGFASARLFDSLMSSARL